MQNNTQRTQTSTQIRNFYSEGMSYLNVRFFNTNLSFSFYPFISRDGNGISKYDMKNGQQTTVNYEGAYALYKIAMDILDNKVSECDLPVPCLAGAMVTLKREIGADGKYQTIFSITKNNMTIPFKFQTTECTTRVNGQVVTTTIESGLGAFCKTLDGYLSGINADRHLDKLTEDFVALQQQNGNNNSNNNNQQSNNNSYSGNNNNGYRNYNNNNGGSYNKKPYYNNNKKPYYNNNGGWKPQSTQPNQQNMSSYNIPN